MKKLAIAALLLVSCQQKQHHYITTVYNRVTKPDTCQYRQLIESESDYKLNDTLLGVWIDQVVIRKID